MTMVKQWSTDQKSKQLNCLAVWKGSVCSLIDSEMYRRRFFFFLFARHVKIQLGCTHTFVCWAIGFIVYNHLIPSMNLGHSSCLFGCYKNQNVAPTSVKVVLSWFYLVRLCLSILNFYNWIENFNKLDQPHIKYGVYNSTKAANKSIQKTITIEHVVSKDCTRNWSRNTSKIKFFTRLWFVIVVNSATEFESKVWAFIQSICGEYIN